MIYRERETSSYFVSRETLREKLKYDIVKETKFYFLRREEMDKEAFKTAVARDFGIELTDKQMKQFHDYYQLLVSWNEKMNLTAITNEEEVYLKHFYDSLTLLKEKDRFEQAETVCDVGAGAGFPSIPLKIALPHLKVTIVDSLNKRIQFLLTLVETLELTDISLYHDRAETFGKNKAMRESFDIVTARAVARLNVLLELCTPLVKVNGAFIALKASQGRTEVAEANHAMEELSVELEQILPFTLPQSEDERTLMTFKKIGPTKKKYPRKPGTPNKNPL